MLLVLAVTAACRAVASSPPAVAVPAGVAKHVTLTRIASGLSKPVALAFAPGDASGRLFVVEKTGTVRIMRNGTIDPKSTPFLDLAKRVSGASEQGLLGLAFHPRYRENRRLYVNLTDRKGDTRVLELQASAADPDGVDPASERELLFVDQPYANHNGGNLAFGPDGLLYVGLGDGGAAGDPHGNGQNPKALLGKMLTLERRRRRTGRRRRSSRSASAIPGAILRSRDRRPLDRRRRAEQVRGGRRALRRRAHRRDPDEFRLERHRGAALLPRADLRSDARSRRPSSSTTTATAARSPAGTSIAGSGCPRSSDGTSTPTTARR